MKENLRIGNPVSRRSFSFVVVASIVLLGSAAAAPAQSWLEKARKLLTGEETSEQATAAALTEAEIGAGLKEALTVGTARVVERLGAKDGFNADPTIHIPLPRSLVKVQSALEKVGMSSLLDDLELRMNRAAEAATPRAKALFVQAIGDLTLDDVMAIYRGPDDAATRYFENHMSDSLAAEMRPIVDETLADAGAVQAYEKASGQYEALPFAPSVETDLTGYVVDEATSGIFHYLAQEEAAIRKDPVKRSTELLRKVFGGA